MLCRAHITTVGSKGKGLLSLLCEFLVHEVFAVIIIIDFFPPAGYLAFVKNLTDSALFSKIDSYCPPCCLTLRRNEFLLASAGLFIFSFKTITMKTFRFFKDGRPSFYRLLALSSTLILWAFLPSALAQPRLGVIGGANFSDLRMENADDNVVEYNMRSSFKVGLIGEMAIGNSGFAIQAEPMYVQKGALVKTPVKSETDGLETDLKMNYIELPILAKYSFDLGALRPYLVVGPEFGWMLNAKHIGLNVKEEFREFDFLATGGLGLDIEATDMVFVFVEGRYNYGLYDINAVEDSPVDLYNRGIQIMGGVKLALW